MTSARGRSRGTGRFTRRISADVSDALLGFRLASGLGLRGKREDSCLLSFTEPRQQHDLATGELERGTRKYADSHRTILRRGESSCAGAEVVCDEFFAHFSWTCSHTVQTVVAHTKELLSAKPPIVQLNRKDTAAHQLRTGAAGRLRPRLS